MSTLGNGGLCQADVHTKSYTFVLVGKAGKHDIVKIEDAVAVQPQLW